MTLTVNTPIFWRFPRRILKDCWSHRFRWHGRVLVGWTRIGGLGSSWAQLSLGIGGKGES